MKQEEPICKLCRQQPADKENSHIIPKFLAKSLYDLSSPRHSLALHKTGHWEKRQDTPKEDHIFCSICEKRFEVLETYFSKRMQEFYAFALYPEKFTVNSGGGLLTWKKVSPVLFRLFVYSVVWRCSMSSIYDFNSFQLSGTVEENLRSILHQNLYASQTELLNNLPDLATLPTYHICMMKPVRKTTPPGGMYSVYSYNENLHLLMLVDFLFFFITDDKAIDPKMKTFSNNYYPEVVSGLLRNDHWEGFNRHLYQQMMDHINRKSA